MENKDQAATGFCNELGGSYNHGLTKRELIAAMAMQGLLAANIQVEYGDHGMKRNASEDEIAKWSTMQADYLLSQLNKTL